jgi:hypothetical protein
VKSSARIEDNSAIEEVPMQFKLERPARLITFCLALGLAASAEAQAGKRKDRAGGIVTACSTYGHGCISAPTRQGKWGPEMRLKGGTWIDCESDCRETLRVKTVDFWDTLREMGGGDGGH